MKRKIGRPDGASSIDISGDTGLPLFVPFGVANTSERDPLLVSLLKGLPKLYSHRDRGATLAAVVRPLIKRSLQQHSSGGCSIELDSGTRYIVDPTDHFAAGIAFGILGEQRDLNTFLRLVEPSSIVLDIGANFGLYTLESARLITTGRVFAFEPVPEIFELLQRNIAANGLERNVEAALAAVAADSGERRFYVSAEGSFSGLSDTRRAPVARDIVVQCAVIDELLSLSDCRADLIKIDVEGTEAEVLHSARGLIARSPEIIVQFEAQTKNMDVENSNALVEMINEFRQTGFELRAGWNNPSPGEIIPGRTIDKDLMVGNLYLTRRGSRSERRLIQAIEEEKAAMAEQAQRAPTLEETFFNLVEQLRLEIRRMGHLEMMLQQIKAEIGSSAAPPALPLLDQSAPQVDDTKSEIAKGAALQNNMATREEDELKRQQIDLDNQRADLKRQRGELSLEREALAAERKKSDAP